MCLMSSPSIPKPKPPPPPPPETEPMQFQEPEETSKKRMQLGTAKLQIPLGGVAKQNKAASLSGIGIPST